MRTIDVFECESVVVGDRMHTTSRRARNFKKEVVEVGVEEARAKAKELLLEAGYRIRSINFKPDGNIHAVVWKGEPPGTQSVPGWVWKRPPNQPVKP